LKRADVATGDLRILWDDIDNVGPSVSGVPLLPLGLLAFYRDSDVFIVDYWLNADGRIEVDPTSVVKVTDPDSHDDAPSFSPDGTFLAYRRWDPDVSWQIVVLGLLSDQEIVVLDARRVAWSPDGSQLGISARTSSSRGNSSDLFRITNWDDPANRQLIQVTHTDGSRDWEITPA
jgi:Tol biopolymer transport system component